MHIKNLERKIKDYNENLTLFDQQFVIIPYLASGYIDYSNFGQVSQQRLIDNYETYKRLWTGNDSFTITWKDSVSFVNTNADSAIKMNYQIGDAILGWLEMSGNASDISTDTSFNEYKAQTVERALTFRINANEFQLDTNFELMFFKVPEISNNVLYRVDSLDREYLGKDLVCYTLSLKALNQDLANTGRAKQQNVMPNSPGQGYYDVAIVQDYTPQQNEVEGIDYKPFFNRYLVADKSKMFNNPAKKVVVKAFGLCGFSNITFWGRKITAGGDFRDFGIPRIIFPINLTNVSTYTLYRTQSEEVNYYWVNSLAPTIIFNTDTFTALKTFLETNWVWPQQGFAKINDTAATMRQTNPIENGAYKYQLFGQNQLLSGSLGHVPWTFATTGTVTTDINYGCAQTFNKAGTKTIHDAMFDAYWTQKQMKTLPINSWNTLGFGWTIGASFAASVARNFYSAAAMLLLGIGGNLIQRTQAPKFQGFSCMVPANLMDFMVDECSGTFGTNFNNQIKLSYFDSYDRDNNITQFFNTQTMNTSFEADLTDLIVDPQHNVYETTCIGQTTYEDGTNILASGKPLLMDGTYKLSKIPDENTGFIIDSFNIQALFKGDYSIEFLDKQGTVIWSGVFQSQGKWTSSIREINTWVNTSIYGRENMFLAQPLPWPKTPMELNLIGLRIPDVDQTYDNWIHGGRFETGVQNDNTIQQCLERIGYKKVDSSNPSISQFNLVQPTQNEIRGSINVMSWTATMDDFLRQYPSFSVDISNLANFYAKPSSDTIQNTITNSFSLTQQSNTADFDFFIQGVAGLATDFSQTNGYDGQSCSTKPVVGQVCNTYSGYMGSLIENVTVTWSCVYQFRIENQRMYFDYILRPTTIKLDPDPTSWNPVTQNNHSSISWDGGSSSTSIRRSNNYAFGACVKRLHLKPAPQ